MVEREAPLVAELRAVVVSPESLFHDHYGRLVRSLGVACDDAEEAADAVQEAFIQLCLHWQRVSRYDNPEAWVRRVAVNRLHNRRRSLRRRAVALARLLALQPETGTEPDSGVNLREALEKLPDRQRMAVALHYVGNLSVAEVARAMGISEGSVNTHLHRARAALRPVLEAQACSHTTTAR